MTHPSLSLSNTDTKSCTLSCHQRITGRRLGNIACHALTYIHCSVSAVSALIRSPSSQPPGRHAQRAGKHRCFENPQRPDIYHHTHLCSSIRHYNLPVKSRKQFIIEQEACNSPLQRLHTSRNHLNSTCRLGGRLAWHILVCSTTTISRWRLQPVATLASSWTRIIS